MHCLPNIVKKQSLQKLNKLFCYKTVLNNCTAKSFDRDDLMSIIFFSLGNLPIIKER